MKSKILSICLLFVLVSCQKENLLEGVDLPKNEYENSTEVFASITGASQITCTLISVDIEIYDELIPDSVEYTHVRIYGPFGDVVTTDKSAAVIRAKCDQLSEYKVTLYKETPERESSASSFEFTTSK